MSFSLKPTSSAGNSDDRGKKTGSGANDKINLKRKEGKVRRSDRISLFHEFPAQILYFLSESFAQMLPVETIVCNTEKNV